jgi:hypothetical protein
MVHKSAPMFKHSFLFLLLSAVGCLFTVEVRAQNKPTLSGYVKDSLSGETLIGATLSINGKSAGVNSNQYGYFSITLPAGTYNITCSFVGYRMQQVSVDLQKSQSLSFFWLPRLQQMKRSLCHQGGVI